MPNRNTYHITQREDGDWQVRGQGASRASAVKGTKAEAVSRGAEIARNKGNSQLIIHKQDGKIQEERTYDNDPYPPPG
jgi:uncharacterized protein YdaT